MYTGSLQKVETNRFARADLEYKLLLVDDDMKTEALPQTNNIKTLVTLEDKIDIERKGQQSVQGTLYVRFACFGNGSLHALYDKSNGFSRRWRSAERAFELRQCRECENSGAWDVA